MTLPRTTAAEIAPRVAFVLLAIASGLGIAGKLSLIARITHLPQVVAGVVVAVALCLPLLWRVAIRYSRVVAPLLVVGILAASVLIYPKIAGLHAEGRGSDQADCVIVAAQKMTALRFPYGQGFLWSKHPMSCGPGWVLLQAPAVRLAGYSFNLILLWALSLFTLNRTIGRSRTLAFAALLALAPGVWLGAANGSDFVTFGVVLAAIVAAASVPGKSQIVATLAAVLAFQFRPPAILLAGFLRQPLGRGRAVTLGLAAILLQLAFALVDPPDFNRFGPFFLWRKVVSTGGPVDHPLLLALAITAGLILGLLATLQLGRYVSPLAGSLGFLALLLVPMAMLNLLRYIQEFGLNRQALGLWEGGVWLTACLPLAALAVAMRCPVTDA